MCSNTKKTEDKVESLETEIAENKAHFEELEKEFKQMEVDAAKVMEDHKKAQVTPSSTLLCYIYKNSPFAKLVAVLI